MYLKTKYQFQFQMFPSCNLHHYGILFTLHFLKIQCWVMSQ